MADKTRMEKVDMAKAFSGLSDTDKHFVRKLEGMNKTRAGDLGILRKKNKLLGLLLSTGVLSIYCRYWQSALYLHSIGKDFYSMYAVQQEKFLDFDKMPEDTKKNVS